MSIVGQNIGIKFDVVSTPLNREQLINSNNLLPCQFIISVPQTQDSGGNLIDDSTKVALFVTDSVGQLLELPTLSTSSTVEVETEETEETYIESVTFSSSSITVYANDRAAVAVYNIIPSTATNTTINAVSSNTNYATVEVIENVIVITGVAATVTNYVYITVTNDNESSPTVLGTIRVYVGPPNREDKPEKVEQED